MILDGVIRPPGKHLGHLCPLVAMGGVGKEEDPLLVRHPFDLEDAWIEVVVPSLTALLPQPSLNELGDEGPTLRSILFH